MRISNSSSICRLGCPSLLKSQNMSRLGSHLFGYNNRKSKRTEYSNFIFYSHFYTEIYKGNSEKYKGKIRKQDISVFSPKHNFVGYLRWLAVFLRS